MSDKVLGAIWAQTENGVIGRQGDMPWYAPEDLAHFKSITLGSPVMMGRKTWESFPPRFRPLPGRLNLIISRSVSEPTEQDGGIWVPSVEAALERTSAEDSEQIWLIGGAQLYNDVLPRTDLPHVVGGCVSIVERTVFSGEVTGDAFAPSLDKSSWKLAGTSQPAPSEKGYLLAADGSKSPLTYRFESWTRSSLFREPLPVLRAPTCTAQ